MSKSVMEADIHLIEFYIKRYHNTTLDRYFSVSKPMGTDYRKNGLPSNRKYEFITREGTIDTMELFLRIYPLTT